MSKCPACNNHELLNHTWISNGEYSEYKDDDYYDCANCGAVRKEYVDAVAAQLAELREALESIDALGVGKCLWDAQDITKSALLGDKE